jgi:hypothetical protein
MANKRLIYNASGSNIEVSNSGSLPAVYFNDTQNSLVVNRITISSITSSIPNNGILVTDAEGKLSSILTSSLQNNSYLRSDGTRWTFLTASGQITGNFVAGSDVSGSFSNATMRSVGNITSGILSANNGGTGISTFTSGGVLIKDGTSTIKTIKPDSAGSVLRPSGNSWISGGATYSAAAVSFSGIFITRAMSPYTWTKPAGHKNIKVILMGGGGGGGAGRTATPGGTGGGGGNGGLSVYDFYETGSLSATITVGAGGTGGVSTGTFPSPPGNPGGDTSFSSPSGIFVYSGGGGGGGGTGSGASFGALGQRGFTNLHSGSDTGRDTYAGSGRGSSGRYGNTAANPQQVAGVGNYDLLIGPNIATGGAITPATGNWTGTPGNFTTTSIGVPGYYAIVGGGGGGGAVSGNGGNGVYGSGGGGTGNAPAGWAGGTGGDGYAIIISW